MIEIKMLKNKNLYTVSINGHSADNEVCICVTSLACGFCVNIDSLIAMGKIVPCTMHFYEGTFFTAFRALTRGSRKANERFFAMREVFRSLAFAHKKDIHYSEFLDGRTDEISSCYE